MTTTSTHWQPTASIENLRRRAEILQQVRQFFIARGVFEVETPLLATTTATDPPIASIPVESFRYLQTSPEFAMKRLLAAGSGSIFQICKAFRGDEVGHLHNPEFTMLEWYRLDFNLADLMQETDELLQTVLKSPKAVHYAYADLFQQYLHINPHHASVNELKKIAEQCQIAVSENLQREDRDTWLHLLMSHVIEPKLGFTAPAFVYDYPASQAALAKITEKNGIKVAERFEVYLQGIELANGYYELTDAKEQRHRFLADVQQRKKMGLPIMPVDERLIAALTAGMPDCAGIALGIDRLVMLALKCSTIADALSFTWENV